jgi:Arc/MetJ-type ribon-helix-helix transcriptional regulator
MTTQIAVRLPEELISRLDALVPATHSSRSEVVRRAIELYLYRLACEHDARQYERLPLSDAELSLADDPDAWRDTPPRVLSRALGCV